MAVNVQRPPEVFVIPEALACAWRIGAGTASHCFCCCDGDWSVAQPATWQDMGSRRLYVARARLYVARESSGCGSRCAEMAVCVSLRCSLCVGAATETLASGLT